MITLLSYTPGLQAKSKRTSRPSTSTSPKLINNSTTSQTPVNSAPLNLPARAIPLAAPVWSFTSPGPAAIPQHSHSHSHSHNPTASTSQLLPPTSITHSHNHSNTIDNSVPSKSSNTTSPSKSKPKPKSEDSTGSCPGGGICNGQGGKTCCEGCPAFNNRVMYKGGSSSAGKAAASASAEGGSIVDGKVSKNLSKNGSSSELGNGSIGIGGGEGGDAEGASEVTAMECFNCHTRKFMFCVYNIGAQESNF